MKNFDINQHHPLITAYHILITTKVIHPIVSHLPGLLLLVVVAVHIAVDHQLTCTKCGQTGWKYKKNFHVNHNHHSISCPSWRKFLPKWYILVLATSLVFSSLLSLPSTVPSNTNPHVLNVVRHVESKNNFHVNHHHHSISRPSWRKFQLMWYILMSGTSLVFSFLLSLPSMVSSTAKSHVINVVRDIGHVESIKKLPGKPPLPQHIRS